MKIYKSPESFNLSYQEGKLCVNASNGGKFNFNNGKASYIGYSVNQVPYKKINFKGIWYTVYSMKPMPRSFLPYKNNMVSLKSHNGCELKLSAEKLYCLVNNRNSDQFGKYIVEIRDYPERRKYSLALFDSDVDGFSSCQINLYCYIFINDYFYGYDSAKNEILKINTSFKTNWVFSPNSKYTHAKQPFLFDCKIVTFIGPKEESRHLIKGRSQYSFSGGFLVGLNDADGSLAWECDMPNAVDNYQLVGTVLYVTSLNKILLINPANGELINSIDTKASVPFDRSFGPSVYVDDTFIYYSHYDDAMILIYEIESLTLKRRIDLPAGYYARGHNFSDEVSGKQYFTLANRTQYVAQGPVLEIDPQCLDEALEFETEPDVKIELRVSPDNAAEKELLIRLTSESLDDALRFGEIYTRDESQRYSFNYTNMTFQDREFTPDMSFNGVIRFVYSGCNKTADIVEQHLKIMEKRFYVWAEKEGFYSCVDKKQLTQLKTEYISEHNS